MVLFDSSLYSVIQIDLMTSSINFYKKTNNGKGEIVEKAEHFSSKFGSDEFFETLKSAVSINYNKKTDGKTALVLPDELFFIDTVKLPLIQKKAMENSLGLAVNALYENSAELKYGSFVLSSDKQNANYCVIGIKKDILSKTVKAVEDGGVDISAVTFTSNSAVSGAIALCPKIKNEDFLLADVKADYTRFSLAVNGKTAGFFTVPIGYKGFSENDVVREYEFFDHTVAERVVEMAKAKAKNKKTAVIKAIETEDEESSVSTAEEETVVVSARYGKPAKRYPKFMVRETPTDAKECVYECFRPILKWIDEVLISNEEILSLKRETPIYFNLPSHLSYLVEMANAEGDGLYNLLQTSEDKIEMLSKIDLYGGFSVKKGKVNLF